MKQQRMRICLTLFLSVLLPTNLLATSAPQTGTTDARPDEKTPNSN
jgi:hypothetical protein